MGTPREDRETQAREVVEELQEQYPDATISLEFSTRWELLVAVVLSGQCTDERVNAVTPDLFDEYSGPEDYADAGAEELAEEIASITYPNQKAGWIVEAAERVVEEHGGEVPDTMAALTDLPGVGRKTANVVLQHGHDTVEGIVVDTHVQRLSRRLGLVDAERPEAIETELMDLLPAEEWRDFTHLFISHGRAVCTARTPECGDCLLEGICPSSRLDAEVDLATDDPWEE